MNYQEFLKFKKEVLKDESILNISENNLYNFFSLDIIDSNSGHINGKVHRCHLVEDWLSFNKMPYPLKKHIGVSSGVRNSLSLLLSHFKNKKYLIPKDVYPFYQEELNKQNITYYEYTTLSVNELYLDILSEKHKSCNMLLITDPLKPLGKDVTEKEYENIKKWLLQDKNNILIIDCAYLINNQVNPFLMNLYEETQQVIMLFSLSKSWCIPNHLGFALLPEAMQELQQIFKNLERNEQKLRTSYMALNKYKNFPSMLEMVLEEKQHKLEELLGVKFMNSFSGGYLFYCDISFEEMLNNKLLTIPVSVYNGDKGVIVSSLTF